MKILKEVKEYLGNYYSIDRFTEGKSIIYQVAFVVLAFLYCVVPAIKYILLTLTFPVWLVPYLIYLKRKEGGIE